MATIRPVHLSSAVGHVPGKGPVARELIRETGTSEVKERTMNFLIKLLLKLGIQRQDLDYQLVRAVLVVMWKENTS